MTEAQGFSPQRASSIDDLPPRKLDCTTFEHRGWKFTSSKGSISGSSELQHVQNCLTSAPSIPEMFYGSNYLTVEHINSHVQIHFDALEALAAWVDDPPTPIRVKKAKEWSELNAQEIENANATLIEYDWTYTTSYLGTIQQEGQTYQGPGFSDTEARINRALLLERAPILFSAEIPLYESEMDDNGVSSCTVRIRVMPECWFLLLRFWLRVDDTMIRIREARYFCNFSRSDEVLREVKQVEGTYEGLAEAGAPCTNAAFADADSASMAMQAAIPVGVVRLENQHLVISSADEA